MSFGVTMAHSTEGKGVLGLEAAIGTRADVEMAPLGSLPSGCTEFAGHLG